MENTFRWVRRRRLTLSVAGLSICAYLTTLLLAGSLQNNAAYAYLINVRDPFDVIITLSSPFLHSSHFHLIQNLVFFVLFGSLVEKRTEDIDFLGFIIIAGLLGNSIIAPIVAGPAIGISGVNYGLKAREAVHRSIGIINGDRFFSTDIAVFGIALLLIIKGFLVPPPGSSYAAHTTGLLIGLVWETQRLNSWNRTIEGVLPN